MPRFKKVDGQLIELSSQEEADALAANKRFKNIGNDIRVQFSDTEEVERDAEETQSIFETTKIQHIEAIKKIALQKIQSRLPDITSIEVLQIVSVHWTSLAPSAKQVDSDFQYAIDIDQIAKTEIITVKTMTTQAALDAYDPNAIAWP